MANTYSGYLYIPNARRDNKDIGFSVLTDKGEKFAPILGETELLERLQKYIHVFFLELNEYALSASGHRDGAWVRFLVSEYRNDTHFILLPVTNPVVLPIKGDKEQVIISFVDNACFHVRGKNNKVEACKPLVNWEIESYFENAILMTGWTDAE